MLTSTNRPTWPPEILLLQGRAKLEALHEAADYNFVRARDLGVGVYCLYGGGRATVERLIYDTAGFPDSAPRIEAGDGDGTVNLRSLAVCAGWQSRLQSPLTVRQYDRVGHNDILYHQAVIDDLLRIATASHPR